MRIDKDKYKELAPVLVILAACFLVYLNALSNRFVYDDYYLVVWNPLIKAWQNIPAIFTTGYWQAKGETGGLYRPLTILSFTAEYSLARLSPFIYHFDNVVLHALCSLLVYSISRTILKEGFASFAAALIFAVHPVHTEAVAWVSGRAELLSVFFYLLSALIFIKNSNKPSFVLLSASIFLLALLAKETAVTLPLFLALYIFLYDRPDSGRALMTRFATRLSPYIAAFITYFLTRTLMLGGKVAPPPESAPLYFVTPYHRFLTMCQALYEYIRLSLIPTNLSVDYFFLPRSLFNIKVLLPILLVIFIAALTPKMVRSYKNAYFAMLMFLIALLPVSNIIPIGIIMSERAAYLPSMGACMLLGIAVSKAGSASYRLKGVRLDPSFLVLAAILAAYTALTVDRNPYWKDRKEFEASFIEIMRKRTEQFPRIPVFYTNLGKALISHGDFGPETEKVLKESIRLNPDNPFAHAALATVYESLSRLEEALSEINIALKQEPTDEIHYKASEILYKLGRKDEADKMLDEAVLLNPYRGAYYLTKASIHMEEGDEETAMRLLDKAVMMDPDDPTPYIKQGIILGKRKDFTAAVSRLKMAIQLQPDLPDAHYYLAIAYVGTGNIALSGQELNIALRLKPGYKDASDLLNRIRR